MIITNELIQDAISKEPELTYIGFYSPTHHRRSERKNTDYVAQLRSYQSDLYKHVDEIQLCADWLALQDIGQKVTDTSFSSYTLKHAVEFATRRSAGMLDYIYVSNGAFLAAVIINSVPFKRVEFISLNASVAVKHYKRNQKFWPLNRVNNSASYTEFKPYPANYWGAE